MPYSHVMSKNENEFRDTWISQKLSFLANLEATRKFTLIDVGAGSSPYKNLVAQSGIGYFSHDFSAYIPDKKVNEVIAPGLQNKTWDYAEHDFVCDILDLDSENKFDFSLCTEVLEHVPDPVAALKKIVQITEANGYICISVPFLSLMHQAPYWFSSGLSPFWFEYWSKELNLEIIELTVYGDYVDLITQELQLRFFNINLATKVLKKFIGLFGSYFRKKLSTQVVSSGAYGVLFFAKKN